MTIKMKDKDLRESVMAELEFEPSIDAADIAVAVEDGVVTLSGHTPSYGQKIRAERAAWRVKGVKAIAQDIEVRVPGAAHLSDDELARRALDMLAWNSSLPKDRIKCKVQNSWITLIGEVKWNFQREAAEKTVRNLQGVMGVTNDITLKPVETVKPTEVREHIVNALKRQAELDAGKIKVSVLDTGVVSLDGTVKTWDEREAAEFAAWGTPGVREVRDHLVLQ